METLAIVIDNPGELDLRKVALREPGPGDVIVETHYSGVSTGTERLFWNGQMPFFPGMGYPLVPGYETVGVVVDNRASRKLKVGDHVFVPGANCYENEKGLFGASSGLLIASDEKLIKIDPDLKARGTLFALAATARHAIAGLGNKLPSLIVGHGVLGRLLARLTIAAGGEPPIVWESNPLRADNQNGYEVIDPEKDNSSDHESIYEASGDIRVLDKIIPKLKKNGEIVFAGFYSSPISFSFPPAFIKEARFRISAEFNTEDINITRSLLETGALSLEGLISHEKNVKFSKAAYRQSFEDPECLKMVIDWRDVA
jgi:3-hydroxyethyl bacteriochlorophyllide a dehydrogenase